MTTKGRPGAPLVVVLSERTLRHVQSLAAAGWDGPVVIVGSVGEARQALGEQASPAHRPHREQPRPALQSTPTLHPTGLRLDVDRQAVHCGEGVQRLTPLEFGVLEALLRSPGRVLRYAELVRDVWGVRYTGDSSSLHAVVRRLRRKLLAVGTRVELEAVRGIGFRIGHVEPSAPPSEDAGLATG